jgi:hypothetical protein
LKQRRAARRVAPSESQQAIDLIAAIDAGELPLNPARVNDISRQLGLEVSRSAPMDATIARIRAALARPPPEGPVRLILGSTSERLRGRWERAGDQR